MKTQRYRFRLISLLILLVFVFALFAGIRRMIGFPVSGSLSIGSGQDASAGENVSPQDSPGPESGPVDSPGPSDVSQPVDPTPAPVYNTYGL